MKERLKKVRSRYIFSRPTEDVALSNVENAEKFNKFLGINNQKRGNSTLRLLTLYLHLGGMSQGDLAKHQDVSVHCANFRIYFVTKLARQVYTDYANASSGIGDKEEV